MITRDKKKGENVTALGIAEMLLAHCDIANSNYQRNLRVSMYLFQVNNLVNYLRFRQ